jgi:CDP-2,3-bis-(O-geranylgeranyl)-sn-glycerol synthase
MNELLWFLVFFIPAYIANMAPVFVRKLNFLAYPIDGGATVRGRRMLGANKTWRGLIFGTLLGGVAGAVMQYTGLPFTWWWGFFLGFAALLGDSIKSFFKRQFDVRPGGRWMPWDQLDFIIVAFLMSLLFVRFSWWAVVLGFIVIFVGDVIVQIIGGKTKLKADSL